MRFINARPRNTAAEIVVVGALTAARSAVRTEGLEAYAVTALATSSSSSSSSMGAKVESGLVESVIGLRPL